MSKSKKRPPKRVPIGPGKKLMPSMSRTLVLPDGSQRRVPYQPGRLKVDIEFTVFMLERVPGDFGAVYLPAALLLDGLRGQRANVCVDACLALQGTYALLGIDARITPVSVAVDAPDGGMSLYGERPRWEDDAFCGHCILSLPGMGRFVDPTIQQFPELSSEHKPFIGRLAAAGHPMPGGLEVGLTMPVVRDGVAVTYTVVGTEDLITESAVYQRAAAINLKSPGNLAGWTLSVMMLPGLAEQIRAADLPRIHALMDAIGDAEVDAGPAGYRFLMPGPDGTRVPTLLDDIPLDANRP